MAGSCPVVAGADTHSQTHHVAVVDQKSGAVIADKQFPATNAGYRDIVTFVAEFGHVTRFGVEGTNSYGAGLTRHLRAAGIDVVEVIRPNRAERRLHGKSDPLDAITAAKVALSRTDLPTPKSSDGPVEAIRVLSLVRDSAVKARSIVLCQIKMILVSAPVNLRERLAPATDLVLLETLRRCRPGDVLEGVDDATMTGLRHLARRHQHLSAEIDEVTGQLRRLIEQTAPALLAAKGIGVVTAAQLLVTAGDNPERITSEQAFAALCGVSPIPASSGKTNRNRINHGGDRRANCALHQIALVRYSSDARTKAYVAKKVAEGKSVRDAIRCLKRAIAREVYHLLTNPPTVPRIDDLRPARQALGLSLQTVARHFGIWPAHVSTIERGKRRDDEFTAKYRRWLTEQKPHKIAA